MARVIEFEDWAVRAAKIMDRRKRNAMDPTKMLQDLLEQRQLIDATIGSVERLVAATKRKGRPPKAVMEARSISGNHVALLKRKGGKRESPAGAS